MAMTVAADLGLAIYDCITTNFNDIEWENIYSDSDIASNLDIEDIANCVNYSDLANELDINELIENYDQLQSQIYTIEDKLALLIKPEKPTIEQRLKTIVSTVRRKLTNHVKKGFNNDNSKTA